jgi:hypothetical protein
MAEGTTLRFTITLTDLSKIDDADTLAETGFFGLGSAYRLADPNVLYLRVREDVTYEEVTQTLEELRIGGALTYVEQSLEPRN